MKAQEYCLDRFVSDIMKSLRAYFEIAEDLSCPLYDQGELMQLSDKTFSCTVGKEVCLILVRDMTQLLFTLLNDSGQEGQGVSPRLYSCSGCTGLLKFRQVPEPAPAVPKAPERAEKRVEALMQDVHGTALESRFLESIPADKIRQVLSAFKEVVVPEDTVLVQQGEQNSNLYLIVAGEFAVETRGEQIATLGSGEIFGEMSYLISDTAIATVKSLGEAKVLTVRLDDFCAMLESESSVQGFMARLLANRLQQINQARASDFESCMTGKLDEVLPPELFQVFHMHQKTGVLSMTLAGGEARVSFREGGMVNASYGEKDGQEAIFAILGENTGYYRFISGLPAKEMQAAEIGDFMALLMEGIRRVDEAGKS